MAWSLVEWSVCMRQRLVGRQNDNELSVRTTTVYALRWMYTVLTFYDCSSWRLVIENFRRNFSDAVCEIYGLFLFCPFNASAFFPLIDVSDLRAFNSPLGMLVGYPFATRFSLCIISFYEANVGKLYLDISLSLWIQCHIFVTYSPRHGLALYVWDYGLVWNSTCKFHQVIACDQKIGRFAG